MGFFRDLFGLSRDQEPDEEPDDLADVELPCRPPNVASSVPPPAMAREDPRVVKQRIMKMRGVTSRSIVLDQERCQVCGNCVYVCPDNAITVTDRKVIDEDLCTTCGCCVSTCPHQAISVVEDKAAATGSP